MSGINSIEESKGTRSLLLPAYLDSANDAIFVIDEQMQLLLSNKVLSLWLHDAASFPGNTTCINSQLIGLEDSISIFTEQHRTCLAGKPVRFECLIRPKGGLPRWVEISMNQVAAGNEKVEIIGIIRDINTHKNEINQLKHLSVHDELTGLLNRREFLRRLQFLMSEKKQANHSLLYMDLDQFKIVNDTCGHAAGDELLNQLASVIKRKMRATDTLARLGGDEFGIILEHCSTSFAIERAKTILDVISNYQFNWEGKHFNIGVSIGIASFNPGSEGTECVMGAADAACYVAKNQGRNRIHIYSDSEECSFHRREMDWISRITQAFETDRFRLYYQHIVPITTGYSCFDHHEILLRMLDDSDKPIEPAEFIAAAEKYHLMPLIDRWVVRTLFARKEKELANNAGLRESEANRLCSINLSGASLNDEYFLDFLRDQIALYNIPPHLICFEVTETVAINNLERVSNFLHELRAMGFRFALDDFGSGMSSFTYLKSLPVDFLKIDGSIVIGVTDNKTDLSMVEAIHQIAQTMGIKTIAEFVENNNIMDKLLTIGVDFAQGYGIHRPECLPDENEHYQPIP